jgi:hypothetical protein
VPYATCGTVTVLLCLSYVTPCDAVTELVSIMMKRLCPPDMLPAVCFADGASDSVHVLRKSHVGEGT